MGVGVREFEVEGSAVVDGEVEASAIVNVVEQLLEHDRRFSFVGSMMVMTSLFLVARIVRKRSFTCRGIGTSTANGLDRVAVRVGVSAMSWPWTVATSATPMLSADSSVVYPFFNGGAVAGRDLRSEGVGNGDDQPIMDLGPEV